MILAGRLTATVDGCPVSIDAGEFGVRLVTPALRTAWRIRRASPALQPLLLVLHHHRVGVRVEVGRWFSLEVLPRPAALLRWVMPSLRGLG
jgi:hypothetical protein